MKAIALDMIKASYGKIDPFRRTNSFEVNECLILILVVWSRFHD